MNEWDVFEYRKAAVSPGPFFKSRFASAQARPDDTGESWQYSSRAGWWFGRVGYQFVLKERTSREPAFLGKECK
jgi:hypothetical protein